MTRLQQLLWPLFSLMVFAAVHATAWAGDELVPEDTCIVELTLPEGSTVNVEGDDYGTQRKFIYDSLAPHTTYKYKFIIHYPSDKTTKHTLLLEGGRRVRLARHDPGKNNLELVEMAGLPIIIAWLIRRRRCLSQEIKIPSLSVRTQQCFPTTTCPD